MFKFIDAYIVIFVITLRKYLLIWFQQTLVFILLINSAISKIET